MTISVLQSQCSRCSEPLPRAQLAPWPATGEWLCRCCIPVRMDDEAEGWAMLDALQAADVLPLDVLLMLLVGWCRGQCGPNWTAREQALAAVAVKLTEAADLARGME